jgi:hypothetical protein
MREKIVQAPLRKSKRLRPWICPECGRGFFGKAARAHKDARLRREKCPPLSVRLG